MVTLILTAIEIHSFFKRLVTGCSDSVMLSKCIWKQKFLNVHFSLKHKSTFWPSFLWSCLLLVLLSPTGYSQSCVLSPCPCILPRFSHMTCCSTPKVEAAGSSKVSVNFHQTAWLYISEHNILFFCT